MHRLERSQLLPLPIDEAFDFFADAHNLESITPPWLHFSIVTPAPVLMGRGTLIDYELRLRGLRLHWQSEIVQWTPGHGFVDRQTRGPYSHWEHKHTFEQHTDGTLMRDLVLYRLPLGPLGKLANKAVVESDLRRIFDYRRDAIGRQFDRAGSSHRPKAGSDHLHQEPSGAHSATESDAGNPRPDFEEVSADGIGALEQVKGARTSNLSSRGMAD